MCFSGLPRRHLYFVVRVVAILSTISLGVSTAQPPVEVEQRIRHIQDAIHKGVEVTASARALQADLAKLSGQSGAVAEAISALDKKILAVAGEAQGGRGGRGGGGVGGGRGGAAGEQPETLARLDGEYSTIYGSIDSADMPATAPQKEALAHLDAEMTKLMASWTQIKTVDVPALNQQLKAAGQQSVTVK